MRALRSFPQPFDRGQLRAVGGQPDQDDGLWELHALGDMRGGLVQQDAVQTPGIVLATLVQKETDAVSIEARALPAEGVAGRGCARRLPPVRLVHWGDDLDRLHTVAREPTVAGPGQAQTPCSLAEAPHRLVGGLPP